MTPWYLVLVGSMKWPLGEYSIVESKIVIWLLLPAGAYDQKMPHKHAVVTASPLPKLVTA